MKSQLRREQILQAATKVFAAKGYHRASISDIIKESDIARGTFYLYFDGKREIFSELVDVLLARLANAMKLIVVGPDQPPWRDQIRANLVRIATILLEEKELTRILYTHAMGLDEDFDRKILEFYETVTKKTEGALAMGRQMGLIRKSVDPAIAAHHIVGSMKEVVFSISQQPAGPSAEKIVDQLILYSTDGIAETEESKPKSKRARSR